MIDTTRPGVGEYAPSFADYVDRIGENEDIVPVLLTQLDQILAALGRIPETRGDYRYSPEKWSIKEIVGHLCDTERVFAYRALRIGRGDRTPLPSFDDETYVAEGRAGDRSLADLAAEWGDVRRATIALFANLPAEAWHRQGTASDQSISVRALAYVIGGHVRHHLQVLEERYIQ
jgi:DinB family protein